MTVAAPFKLRTDDRIKDQELPEAQPYEPLWLTVEKSFKLRDQTNTLPVKSGLTKPVSPKLSTLERMKLRDDFTNPESVPIEPVFKARPFNPKIFEKRQDSIKPIEKREST